MIIAVKNFSKEEGRGIVQVLIEFLPETKVDVAHGIYSQTIKTIFGDNFVSYPIKEDFFDLVTFCIEIGKTEKSAFLNSISIIFFVVFILYVTGLMIVRGFVERNNLRKVIILNIPDMVEDDIYHY